MNTLVHNAHNTSPLGKSGARSLFAKVKKQSIPRQRLR
jgi:hypothetical protein